MKRFLWKASGADHVIVAACPEQSQRIFSVIGILVLLIMAVTFASTLYAVDHMFHNVVADVGISIMFSFTLFNMYRFLLITLTKNVLPHHRRGESQLSLVLRISFLLFIAMVISKPIEVFLFDSKLDVVEASYRTALIDTIQGHIDRHYSQINSELKVDSAQIASLHRKGSSVYEDQMADVRKKMRVVKEERHKASIASSDSIRKADFFVYRMKMVLFASPLSILITLLTITLFVLPSILKYKIPDDSPYYVLKMQAERGMVQTAYAEFKRSYSNLFVQAIGKPMEWEEKFTDPPYNTEKKKSEMEVKSQADFLTDLYGNA